MGDIAEFFPPYMVELFMIEEFSQPARISVLKMAEGFQLPVLGAMHTTEILPPFFKFFHPW
jgi:hypothetical protein